MKSLAYPGGTGGHSPPWPCGRPGSTQGLCVPGGGGGTGEVRMKGEMKAPGTPFAKGWWPEACPPKQRGLFGRVGGTVLSHAAVSCPPGSRCSSVVSWAGGLCHPQLL